MLAKIDLQHLIQIIREHMPELLERYDVESLVVFGSFARQEQSPESDLDLLVTFRETPGLLRYIALENYLSDLLGVKVDLVMKDALKPHVGKRILEEVIML